MSKRPLEADENGRQIKKLVTESMVNENDATLMNKIYERTNEALFNGSKKAFSTEGSSVPAEDAYEPDENDVEMEEYFKEENMDVNLNILDDEAARAKYGTLDKTEVNRLIRLQRRSPSPLPREGKCKCFLPLISKGTPRQMCLVHMWGLSENATSPSEDHDLEDYMSDSQMS